LFIFVNLLVIVLLDAVITGWHAFRSFPTNLGEFYRNVQALVREIGKALFRRIAILYAVLSLLIILAIIISARTADAWNRAVPSEYGRVIIKNYSKRAGLAPVIFDHWVHRSRFTCRLCHVDIGFAMEAGGTDITAAKNRHGLYCGACHDGKRFVGDKKIFAACSEVISKEDSLRCDRCHSQGRKVAREYEFTAFAEKLPKTALGNGNGINWEEAEAKGLIKPIDFLEGVSVRRPALKAQKDFSLEVKSSWMDKVLFSHKKHAIWNGCEVCHPEIFPSLQKGATKYSMFQIVNGQYCGVCHDKVAFPLRDCQRCHTQPVDMGSGAP
jgi:c(7)-type cytochrome triheme protein